MLLNYNSYAKEYRGELKFSPTKGGII